MDDAVEESAPCGLCGRRLIDVGGGADATFLEVTHGEPSVYVEEVFCTQQHAAEWLSRPLPARATPEPVETSSRWRDRLVAVTFAFSVLWGLGLMLLGAWAAVRLLGGWN
ncbi:hypothetical protein GCU67_08450 [Modestobacter muralis]|uniref:Uncharacterized protein n=1 Tax=Modestobacter muralis TaxID=1608614 RepID=A0A6P0H5J4_9ACTN|nr:hypothetical protein [Modestobacter muralis]NEK94203.1 hypothetical protein [Modestobacter muralis]NEN50971.1 hypothetical protein [Modestobacter muralis]